MAHETHVRSETQVLDDHGRRLLFTEARTANTFLEEPVSDEVLRSIWELARWPPTSGNTNPMRIVYVRSDEARAQLVGHMHEGNKAKTAAAPAIAVLARDDEFHELVPQLVPYKPGLRDVLAANDDLRESTAHLNSAIQAAYFILAVRAVGLAAGPMVGFDAAGVDHDLLPGSSWRSFLVVNIGRPGPEAWLERLPRPSYEDAVRHV